jgi:hypothetical protein
MTLNSRDVRRDALLLMSSHYVGEGGVMGIIRNLRSVTVLALFISLIVGTDVPSAAAEPACEHLRIEGAVSGEIEYDEGSHIPITDRRVNTGEFQRLGFLLVIDVMDDDPETVIGSAEQPVGHSVRFTSDDDFSMGRGEIAPTDDERAFRAEGLEWRVDDPDPVPAEIEIRLTDDGAPSGQAGRFERHKLLLRMHLTLDLRVERDDGDQVVHCDRLPARIEATLAITTIDPITRLLMVGQIRRHGEVLDPVEDTIDTVLDEVPAAPV